MITALFEKVDTLHSEILIESAYFVMNDPSIEKLAELKERGVRVRVMTNSLASNDVIAAHAGHAKGQLSLKPKVSRQLLTPQFTLHPTKKRSLRS